MVSSMDEQPVQPVSTMEPLAWLRKQLETADVDLLREMVSTFIATLMGAEADALCGAAYGRAQWSIRA
jgi:putative transposase